MSGPRPYSVRESPVKGLKSGPESSESRGPTGKLPPGAILLAKRGGLLGKAKTKISTPLPKKAKIRKDLSATVKIGHVKVVIKPDTYSKSGKRNGGKTAFKLKWTGISAKTRDGKVTSITPPQATVTIRTTYGPGAKPNGPSKYGKGKTLRDHEGHHGTDYVEYLKNRPFPKFKGSKGMTDADFQEAIDEFEYAAEDYIKEMGDFSEKHTDCSGKVKADFCR